jgi:antitoxin component of MazEF toxin-antitoxin module
MITTKVRKVGSSLGVILSRPSVEALGVRDGDEVVITEPSSGRLSIRKISPSSRPFIKVLDGLVQKHRRALARMDD